MSWNNVSRARTSTAEHRRWRGAVLERDGYRCQACGYQGFPGDGVLEADHIRNIKAGGDSSLANGMTLCRDCHRHKTRAESAAGLARRAARRRLPVERHPGLL